MKFEFLAWLGAAMVAFLSAATASRSFVATNNPWVLGFSLALYCVGNLIMVRLMREAGLGLAISVSAVAQLLVINVIAYFAFDERLTTSQITGIGLGLIAMVLLLFPVGAKG
jgi:small multidrug resistance pump